MYKREKVSCINICLSVCRSRSHCLSHDAYFQFNYIYCDNNFTIIDGISYKQNHSAYTFTCLWFAYVEGYKGFQTKFSPLVVSRSFTLQPSSSPFHHLLFAPFYSMGLFHATKKRMIISWSVSIGVAVIVAAVKRLPYPWRNIVDAGVVVGLTWGTISILGGYIISLITGIAPIDVDPSLPEKKA